MSALKQKMLHLTNEEEHRDRNRYKRVHAVCQEKKEKKCQVFYVYV